MKIFSTSYYFLAIFIVWLRGFDAFFDIATRDPKDQTPHTHVNFLNPIDCKELTDGSVAAKEA